MTDEGQNPALLQMIEVDESQKSLLAYSWNWTDLLPALPLVSSNPERGQACPRKTQGVEKQRMTPYGQLAFEKEKGSAEPSILSEFFPHSQVRLRRCLPSQERVKGERSGQRTSDQIGPWRLCKRV